MYDIILDNVCVGKATVHKEGLFYCFRCVCNPSGAGVYRLYVADEDTVVDLGICVPEGHGYTCVARVACKRFSCDVFRFTLEDANERMRIPVLTGMEFAYLEKLNTAHLHVADGQPEIIIDPIQGQQDNGQSLTHLHKSVQI